MYRESLLGAALGATLSELSETHALSEAQREQLWMIFDNVMQTCLEEAPPSTHIQVRVPLPRLPESSTVTTHAPVRHFSEEGEDAVGVLLQAAHEAPSSSAAALSDEHVPFPVYRCVDGLWTILLKNPTVRIRDEYQSQEVLDLDYLKVVLRQTQTRTGASKSRTRAQRAHKS